MSSNTNIETNIVQMKFDNARFEENCKQTMSTLDKLKAKLHSTKTESALGTLGTVAKDLGLSQVEKSLDSVNKKMSILGIAGATVVSELTKKAMEFAHTVTTAVPNIIKQGGWTRAMNIEQAKFQLEGLGITWSRVGTQISNSVSGTAYSMDSAARAASQLAASGIEIAGEGDQMERTLKAISGVAAQTNSSFDDISSIFTTIAGNGRVLAMQLNQLASRGMNAAAAIGQAMGITEAEVRDMVSHGEISFEMFSDIMFQTFGENAFKANQTFSGSLDNMKAALKRTGEAFAGPIQRQMIPVFNALRLAINAANKEIFNFSENNVTDQSKIQDAIKETEAGLTELERAFANGEISYEEYGREASKLTQQQQDLKDQLVATYGPFEKLAKFVSDDVVKVIGKIDFKFLKRTLEGFVNIFKAGLTVIKPFGQALSDILGITQGDLNSTLLKFSSRFEKFTKSLALSTEEMDYLKRAFRGVISVLSIFKSLLMEAAEFIFGIDVKTGNLRTTILKVIGTIGDIIFVFSEWIKDSHVITKVLEGIVSVVMTLVGAIGSLGSKVSDLVRSVRGSEIFKKTITVISNAIVVLVGAVALLAQKVSYIFNELRKGNTSVLGPIYKVIILIKDGVLLLGAAIVFAYEKIKEFAKTVGIIDKITAAFSKLKEAAYGVFGKKTDKTAITITDPEVPKAAEKIGDSVDEAGNKVEGAGKKFSGFTSMLTSFSDSLTVARVASLAFTAALLLIAYKTANALEGIGKGMKSVGNFLNRFSKGGIVGMILGTGDRTPNKLLDTAIALGVLAASLLAISKVPTDKLKEAANVVTGLMTGYIGMITILTYLDNMTGTLGGITNITRGLLQMTVAIIGLSAAAAYFTDKDYESILKGIGAVGALGLELSGLAILLAKFAPGFAVAAGSMAGLALSIDILSMAFKRIITIKDVVDDSIAILVKFAAFTGVIVAVSSFAQRLGGNSSFLRLSASILMLSTGMYLMYNVLSKIKIEEFRDMLDEWTAFLSKNWVKFLGAVAIAVGAFLVTVKLLKAIPRIIQVIAVMIEGTLKRGRTLTDEVRGTVDYIGMALNKMGIAAIILTATAAIVALAGLAYALSKIEDKQSVFVALTWIMLPITAMVSFLIYMSKYTVGAKPTVILSSILAIGTIIAALNILAIMIEADAPGVAKAAAALTGIMFLWNNMLKQMSKIQFDASTYKALVASIAGMAVAVLAIKELTKIIDNSGYAALIVSVGALGSLIYVMGRVFKSMGETGQSWSQQKRTALKEMIGAIAAIGAAITGMTWAASLKGGILALITAAGSLGILVAELAYITTQLNAVDWKPTAWQGFLGITVLASSVALALGGLVLIVGDNTDRLVDAVMALSVTAGAFAGMAYFLGKIENTLSVLTIMGAIAIEALAIATSLALLAKYDWDSMQYAMATFVTTIGVVTLAIIVLDKAMSSGIGMVVGVVVGLIVVAFAALAASMAMLVEALAAFMPAFGKFIELTINTLVKNAEGIKNIGWSLVPFATGLAAVGAAGLILMAGATGLILGAAGIAAVAAAGILLQQVEWSTIAQGMSEFIVPALQFGAVAIALAALSPAMVLAAAGMLVFGAAVNKLTDNVFKNAVDKIKEIPKKMIEIGEWIPKGLAKGMENQKSVAVQAAENIAKNIENKIRDILGIHSMPWDTFVPIGEWIPAGLEEGMVNQFDWQGMYNGIDIKMEGVTDGFDVSEEAHNAGEDIGNNLYNGIIDSEGWHGLPGLISWVKQALGGVSSDISKAADKAADNNKKYQAYEGGTPTDVKRAKQDEAEFRKKHPKTAYEIKKYYKDIREAQNETFTNTETGAGKAGKAVDKLADKVGNLSDAYSGVSKGTKVYLIDMVNNLQANLREHAQWAYDVRTLVSMGYSEATIEWVKQNGVAGHETVKAFKNASAEEIAGWEATVQAYLSVDKTDIDIIAGTYGEAGSEAALAFVNQFNAIYRSDIKETVDNALDPFGEFDAKTEMTGNKLLANMHSQLDGIRKWGDNVRSLYGKLDQDIIDYLWQLGPASYDIVNALAGMTESQLAEVSDLWNQQINLGREQAILEAQKYTEVGLNVAQGLIDGYDGKSVYDTIVGNNAETAKGVESTWETKSPSKRTHRLGENIVKGLENGIKVRQHIPVNILIMMATNMVNEFTRIINYDKGKEIGGNLVDGIKKGIEDGESRIIKSIQEEAERVIAAAYAAYDINSPSKEFRKIGLQIDEGLAQGIDWGSNSVLSSVTALGSSAIDRMAQVIADIADNVNGEFEDISPVITPRLDLTELQNGRSFIDRMFGGTSYSMANSILADQNPSNVNTTTESGVAPVANNQTLIFNQTNNSPKSIDAYESYRLGRIALQQMKGAFT